MCQNCGNSVCGGNCKKGCLKIYKPTSWIGGQTGIPGPTGAPGVGIVNIIDNGNGTFTVYLSDATNYIITIPTGTYSPWQRFVAGDVVADNLEPWPPLSAGVTAVDLGFGNYPVAELSYNPLSEYSALLKGFIDFKLDVDLGDPNYDNGGFIATIEYPQFPVAANWLVAKLMSLPWVNNYHSPVRVHIQQQTPVIGSIIDLGAAAVKLDNIGGNNRIQIKCMANFPATGRYNVRMGFDGSTSVIDA